MKKTWRYPLPVHRFRGILRSLVINLFFQPFLNAAFHCAPVSLNPSHRLEGGKGATYLIIIDAAFEIGHREQQSII